MSIKKWAMTDAMKEHAARQAVPESPPKGTRVEVTSTKGPKSEWGTYSIRNKTVFRNKDEATARSNVSGGYPLVHFEGGGWVVA
jgi:hypothetical protein